MKCILFLMIFCPVEFDFFSPMGGQEYIEILCCYIEIFKLKKRLNKF